MKHLTDFIHETVDLKLVAAIKDLLDDPNTTNDAARRAYAELKHYGKLGELTGKIIHHNAVREINPKTGQPYKRNHIITKSYDEKEREDDPNNLGKVFSNIGISPGKEIELIYRLKKSNMLDKYIYYINRSANQLYARDLIANSGTNLYKLYKSFGIDSKTLEQLSNTEDLYSTISQGKFEIYLRMFLKDLNKNNKEYANHHHGDIHAGGFAFELKGETARIGSKAHSASLIEAYIDKELKFKGISINLSKNPLGNKNNIDKLSSDLYNILNSDRKVFDILYQGMLAQFGNLVNKYGGDSLTEQEKNDLTGKIFDKGSVKYTEDGENMVKRLLMAVQLYYYQKEEQFDYLVLFDPQTGDYICDNAQKFTISNLLINRNIKVENNSGGMSKSREDYCKISLKKSNK